MDAEERHAEVRLMVASDPTARPPFAADGGQTLHAWLRMMRNTKPVFYDEAKHMWEVFRYDDAVRVLSDPVTFSSELYRIIPGELGKGNLTMMDPPRHRKVRDLVSRSFTARVAFQLRSRIEEITDQLIDEVADRGEMDLVEDLSYPLPVMVIAELLGLPVEDRPLFRRWANGLLSFGCGNVQDKDFVEKFNTIQKDLLSYLREHYRVRLSKPGDDLISRIATAEIDGQGLTEDEAVNFANLLLVAGHVTTTLLLANLVLSLDEHPDAMAALRADVSLLPSAIEETLRYRPVIAASARLTRDDVVVSDQAIPSNQFISVSTMSANRDGQRFQDPDHYNISRDPNPHLGFGHGIHYCLGAPLARLETKIAMRRLMERFSTFSRTPGSELQFYETVGVVGPKSIPIIFECS